MPMSINRNKLWLHKQLVGVGWIILYYNIYNNISLICDKVYSGVNKIIFIELGIRPQPALYFALYSYASLLYCYASLLYFWAHLIKRLACWAQKCLQTDLSFPEMCWVLPNADLEIATLNFKVQIRHNKFEKAKSDSSLNASDFSPYMKYIVIYCFNEILNSSDYPW